MIRLLKAEFGRCLKGKLFWLMVIFTFVMGVSCNLVRYIDFRRNSNEAANEVVYNDTMLYVGLISASVLVGIFVVFHAGMEFDEGTIRNKLVAGNSRSAIYLCNFAICSFASIVMQYIFFFAAFASSYAFFGAFHHPFSVMMQLQLMGSLGIVALTAFMLMLTMILRSKTISIAVCLIAAVVIFAVGTIVTTDITEHSIELSDYGEEIMSPEKYDILDRYSYVYGVDSENCKGKELFIKEQLYDGLFQCHVYRFSSERELPYHWQYMLIYDIAIIAVTTAAGVFLFRRLDLK